MLLAAKKTLVGFDLNASRALAAESGSGRSPQPVALTDESAELPLALSLEGRTPQVGWAGLALCRRMPHLACVNFLPLLGERREWAAGRHRLDPVRALALVFERLRAVSSRAQAIALALPSYLSQEQARLLAQVADKARWPVQGWLPAPLAVALAAHAEQPWSGPALVLDIDDHALTWAAVDVAAGEARLLNAHARPQLGLRVWRHRLMDAIADRCIRQSRRDPRDSAEAEQGLFDQMDEVVDGCRRGQLAEVVVQMAGWCQHLVLRPDETAAFCAPLVRQVLADWPGLRATLPASSTAGVVLVTAAAARLPGLLTTLEEAASTPLTAEASTNGEDGGEFLLEEETVGRVGVSVLPADAVARMACDLAGRWQRGDLPRGLATSAPLPPPQPFEAGPARVQFRSQDYVLRERPFVLGRNSDCDVVFDGALFPTVSGRHCEIVYERRTYVLRDRSRNRTLVNERPVIHEIVLQAGDWLRLGPGGPLVRFLGQAADQLKLMTTA